MTRGGKIAFLHVTAKNRVLGLLSHALSVFEYFHVLYFNFFSAHFLLAGRVTTPMDVDSMDSLRNCTNLLTL
jgi:hypothetical protein